MSQALSKGLKMNMKFRINSKEQSKEIQEILFQYYNASWDGEQIVRYLDARFLYLESFTADNKIIYGNLESIFIDDNSTELTLEELRNLTKENNMKYLRNTFVNENQEITQTENQNLLDFNDLEENKLYRVLHGGQRDHGYNYVIKNGVLFNKTKNKTSSLTFNKNIKFIETENKFLNLESLDYEVEFHSKGIKVGCQNLTIDDALILSHEIISRYYNN